MYYRRGHNSLSHWSQLLIQDKQSGGQPVQRHIQLNVIGTELIRRLKNNETILTKVRMKKENNNGAGIKACERSKTDGKMRGI